MNQVFFVDFAGKKGDGVLDRLRRLCREAGIDKALSAGDLTAVKLHFGEMGNTRMLRPQLIRVIVEEIERRGALPFLTDCNTLFYRQRYNAVCHLKTAAFNGFDLHGMGAPIIIADGLLGLDYRLVEAGPTVGQVRVGAAIHDADALVTVTHFKGHEDVGFGGIIKNLGMGAIARCGKQQIHSHVKPQIDRNKCDGCGRCLEVCPEGALIHEGGAYRVDEDRCNICGHCLVVCPQQAIPINWERDDVEMQKKLVESCRAVLAPKRGKCFFISFLVDITALCDCRSFSPLPVVKDIGIVAGSDPLAVEQASFDLVQQEIRTAHPGKDLSSFTGVDGSLMLEYAEQIGLGKREYQLEVLS